MNDAPFDLDAIQVAAPCRADWAQMTGDDRVRACGLCKKNVYDLGSLTRGEAVRLVTAREGTPCVRFFRRADGRVLTADCPVGLAERFRRRASRVAAAVFAFLGLAAGAVAARVGRGDGSETTFEKLVDDPPPIMVMGAVCVPVPTPPGGG